MKRRRVTIRDVAERAGVSTGAASTALNPESTGTVSDEIRDQVLAAARELGYQRRERAPRQGPLVAVCGNYDNPDPLAPFNNEVMLGLFRGAQEAGVDLFFLSDRFLRARRESADYYLERTFDVLVAYGVSQEHEEVLRAVGEVRPVVTLFYTPSEEANTVASVDTDNDAIGRLAATELLSCGYDFYLHVADSGGNRFSAGRQRGFEAVIPPEQLLPAIEFPAGIRPWGPESGEPAAEQLRSLLRDHPGKTFGVFAWSDAVAIHIVRSPGLPIPDRIGILGCDGLELATLWLRMAGLSTVWQGVAEIARRGVWLALRRIDGKAPPDQRLVADDLPRLMTRESTTVPVSRRHRRENKRIGGETHDE